MAAILQLDQYTEAETWKPFLDDSFELFSSMKMVVFWCKFQLSRICSKLQNVVIYAGIKR